MWDHRRLHQLPRFEGKVARIRRLTWSMAARASAFLAVCSTPFDAGQQICLGTAFGRLLDNGLLPFIFKAKLRSRFSADLLSFRRG